MGEASPFLIEWPQLPLTLVASRAMSYANWPIELANFHYLATAEKPSLLDGLLLSRARYASMTADYVYGILSLVDLKGGTLRSNYSEETMAAFRNVVLHTIQTEGNLDILTACKGDVGRLRRRSNHHRKLMETAFLKISHTIRLLEKVPHMVPIILNSPERPNQLENMLIDEFGYEGSSESNPVDDDLSVVGHYPSWGSLSKGLQEPQLNALRELLGSLKIPGLRVLPQGLLRTYKLPNLFHVGN